MSKLTSLLLVIFFTIPSFVNADVLLLEGISKEPANDKKGVLRPTQGMTANYVKQTWGIPKSVTEPVGNPPIQRWEYEQFYVFFESEHVINSVFKKKKLKKEKAKKQKVEKENILKGNDGK